MIKMLTTGIAAVSLAAATVSVPSTAQATPAWVVPAIIAGSVGVVVGGAVIASTRADAYEPERAGNIYVQPRVASTCRLVRERTASGWRRVEVCN